MGAALGTRAWRHAYPAIHRELAKDGQARDFLESLYWSKEPVLDNARAAVRPYTADRGDELRPLYEGVALQTIAERESFRRVSMD